jgi:hypothetical protein
VVAGNWRRQIIFVSKKEKNANTVKRASEEQQEICFFVVAGSVATIEILKTGKTRMS